MNKEANRRVLVAMPANGADSIEHEATVKIGEALGVNPCSCAADKRPTFREGTQWGRHLPRPRP
jgi:hypothetical protein